MALQLYLSTLLYVASYPLANLSKHLIHLDWWASQLLIAQLYLARASPHPSQLSPQPVLAPAGICLSGKSYI